MSNVTKSSHQDTFEAFNKLNQDAASNDDKMSAQVKADAADLLADVQADDSLSPSQKTDLIEQVNSLIPLAGVEGHGAEWNKEMQELVDTLSSLNTSSPADDAAGGDSTADAPYNSGNTSDVKPDTDDPTTGSVVKKPKANGASGANNAGSVSNGSTGANTTMFADKTLFPSGPPSTDDIKQGAINDCTVAADLSALATQNPEAIAKLVKKGDDGTYSVGLFLPEGYKEIPVTAAELSANGLKSKTGQVNWASYVEAAVIKAAPKWMEQDLYAMDMAERVPFAGGSNPATVMNLLTGSSGTNGAPSDFGSDSALLTALDTKMSEGKLVNVDRRDTSTGMANIDVNVNGYSIKKNHAYAVVGADPAAGTVTVRNPLNTTGATGSLFTMSVADFKAAFPEIWYQS